MSISVNIHCSIQPFHSVADKPVIKQLPPEIWVQVLEYQNWDYQDLSTCWWVSKSSKLNVTSLIFRRIATQLASLQEFLERKIDNREILETKMIRVIETVIETLIKDTPVRSLHMPTYIFKDKFNQLFKRLPLDLYHLTFHDLSKERFLIDSKLTSLLPSHLMGLHIHTIISIDQDWKWPHNLTELRFDTDVLPSSNLQRILVNQLQGKIDCNFRLFPPNLTYLNFGMRGNEGDLTEQMKEWMFKQLPISLRQLIIRQGQRVSLNPIFDWIEALENLEELNLNTYFLEGEDLKKLPVSLRTLQISGSKLQNEDLQNLPKLTHLTIEEDQITDTGMKYLPRSLMTLALPKNTTITPRSRPDWPKFLQLQVSKENTNFMSWRTRIAQDPLVYTFCQDRRKALDALLAVALVVSIVYYAVFL